MRVVARAGSGHPLIPGCREEDHVRVNLTALALNWHSLQLFEGHPVRFWMLLVFSVLVLGAFSINLLNSLRWRESL